MFPDFLKAWFADNRSVVIAATVGFSIGSFACGLVMHVAIVPAELWALLNNPAAIIALTGLLGVWYKIKSEAEKTRSRVDQSDELTNHKVNQSMRAQVIVAKAVAEKVVMAKEELATKVDEKAETLAKKTEEINTVAVDSLAALDEKVAKVLNGTMDEKILQVVAPQFATLHGRIDKLDEGLQTLVNISLKNV